LRRAARIVSGRDADASALAMADVVAKVEGARGAYDAIAPLVAARSKGAGANRAGSTASATDGFARVDSALAPARDGAGFLPTSSIDAAARRELAAALAAQATVLAKVAANVTRS
jgi:iron uptake system EfeUOB component EfeO/EfeM